MAEAIVSDWITEYETLQPEEMKSFISQLESNHEIATALYSVLADRSKHSEVRTLEVFIVYGVFRP